MRHIRLTSGLIFFWAFFALSFAQSLPREVRTKILESVVQIIPWDDTNRQLVPWSGSGTIISPEGYILTNFHVVGDVDTRQYFEWQAIYITRPEAPDQEPQFSYWARYINGDASTDLAIIKIEQFTDESPIPDSLSFQAMPVGDSNTLLPGDLITVVGYPGISGSTITFTAGLMSGWVGEDFESGGKQWIKTDAKIARGNSGGAAFNERGELIGVPTAGISLLEDELYEEQLYVRPISLAWALIGPNVPTVVRADPSPVNRTAVSNAGTAQPSGSYGAITLGSSISGAIANKTGEETFVFHSYTVEVPAGLEQLTISVDGGGRDVDMAVKAGSEILDYNDVDYLDDSTATSASYTYNNPSAGTIYIDVVNLLEQPINYTVSVTATGTNVPSTIVANTTASSTIGTIQIGGSASGSLAGISEAVSYHTYILDVPSGTPRITISMNADMDLDLAVKFGSEISSYNDQDNGGDWTYRDNSLSNSAQFVIDNPQAGRWYIDVFNTLEPAVIGSYKLDIK